jgi:hypothetical protein
VQCTLRRSRYQGSLSRRHLDRFFMLLFKQSGCPGADLSALQLRAESTTSVMFSKYELRVFASWDNDVSLTTLHYLKPSFNFMNPVYTWYGPKMRL